MLKGDAKSYTTEHFFCDHQLGHKGKMGKILLPCLSLQTDTFIDPLLCIMDILNFRPTYFTTYMDLQCWCINYVHIIADFKINYFILLIK